MEREIPCRDPEYMPQELQDQVNTDDMLVACRRCL